MTAGDVNEITPGAAGRRWLNAFSIGIAAVYALLFLSFLFRSGPKDYDQFLVFHELQYWNTALFGLAKQWTPLMCSGLSLAGEPQVPFMSLSMALGYVFGPLLGLKLATLIYFLIGWGGAFLYAGLWLKQNGPRVLAASLFIGNGFFICRLGFGHIDFIPFLILPLMLWVLHRSLDWLREATAWQGMLRLSVSVLTMGAGIALAIDGSPVAIIHLLFWIALYAVVLAFTQRSFAPVALLGCAVILASLLDAGYLWPMIEAQTHFPRRTENSFTSVLSLLWFAILPVRGKVFPANGNGHELSVFIGPVIAYLLWRYRHWLNASLPSSMKRPLLIVSVISIVLGMGSLKALHIPTWLSPFDLLRPLPGFRSMGVTGRYWGFLALPLSLMGAAALWRFVVEFQHTPKLRIYLSAALLLQLGFQTETVLGNWIDTSPYVQIPLQNQFRRGPEDIEYVRRGAQLQGEFITPTRGVVDCYDMDDFIRADISPGKQLIRRVLGDWHSLKQLAVEAKFLSWNRIQLEAQTTPMSVTASTTPPQRIQLVLNQAFHPLWQAPGCETLRHARGNLIVDCPMSRLQQGPIELSFHNELSEHAAHVSTLAWKSWLIAAMGTLLLFVVVFIRMRNAKLAEANAA